MTKWNILLYVFLTDLLSVMSPIIVDPEHIEVLPCIQDRDPDRPIAIDPGSSPLRIYVCLRLLRVIWREVAGVAYAKKQMTNSYNSFVPLGNSGACR